ncbi:MAG TPA: glycosyltransferase family 39 protein [Thermoanaerobaculia bacterium]|nr:glycosyltransferase family 39 protein [Thermoanaerobaculia bacterium]
MTRLRTAVATATYRRLVPLLLLAAFAAQAAFSALTASHTFDEKTHRAYGSQVLFAHSFERTVHRFNTTSPVMALSALPVLLQGRMGVSRSQREQLTDARLPTILLGVLLGWLVFSWTRAIWGFAAGALALGFYAFCPNVLAHSSLVTTDVVTTLAVFAAMYALWRFWSLPTWPRAVVTGLVWGLALVTKVSSVFLLPISLLAVGVARIDADAPEAPSGLRSRAAWVKVLVAAGIAAVVLNSCYLWQGSFAPLTGYQAVSARFRRLVDMPVLSRLPVPLPRGFVEGLDWASNDLARSRWAYCLGRYSRRGFPHYYVVAMATKATLGLLAAILLAAAVGRPRALTRRHWPFLLVPVLFYFTYFSLFFTFQIGIRHLLLIFPFLFVMVGRLANRSPAIARVSWLLLVLHAGSSLRMSPHYIAYFNEAANPMHGWRYLADSNLDWGQDRASVAAYVRDSKVPMAVNPPGPTAGRSIVAGNALAGLTPGAHARYAWLRDCFEPVGTVGYSYFVYDVSPQRLGQCASAR